MEEGHILHATTVSVGPHALLITGASGRGKSSLALQMIALGAQLIADDRTQLCVKNGQLIADCPPAIAGLIEARGVGILKCPKAPSAAVKLVVDMDQTETARLPEKRDILLYSISLPLMYRSDTPHFAAALMIHLQHGAHAEKIWVDNGHG